MLIFDMNSTYNVGSLMYSEETHEFASIPHMNSDIIFLVGYINIGFDSETKEATQIWGFHHNFNWEKKVLNIPKITKGVVRLNTEIESGDSIRIKEADSWKTYYDSHSGWVRFGNNNNFFNDLCIEFFANTVMEIDKKGNLIALWLKPVFK